MRKAIVLVPVENRELFLHDGWDVVFASPESVSVEDVRDAEVCIGNLPVDMIPSAEKLKWFQSSMAGVDKYIETLPRDVLLTNVTGAFGDAISEHMVGFVFEAYKKLHLYRDNQNKNEWLDRGFVREVSGSTVLVVGLGDIGECFARKMNLLGAKVSGVRRKDFDKPEFIEKIYSQDDLDSILPDFDIVALCLPETEKTRNLFCRERISRMKDSSVLINVGRGSAVDTDALADALVSGKLYAACLDVVTPEPLPSDSILWKLENCIITPHISGFFHMRKTYDNIIRICADNFSRYVCGDEPLHSVNRETGYCD